MEYRNQIRTHIEYRIKEPVNKKSRLHRETAPLKFFFTFAGVELIKYFIFIPFPHLQF